MKRVGLLFFLLTMVSCRDTITGPFELPSPCLPPAQVPAAPAIHVEPVWSPTGDFIVYRYAQECGQPDPQTAPGFYRIFIDENCNRVGEPELLLDFRDLYQGSLLYVREHRISPDGTKMVFCLNLDIWMLDLQTSQLKQLTNTENARWPDWHPGGEWVVYGEVWGEKKIYWDSTGVHIVPDTTGGMHIVNVNTLEDRQLKTGKGHPIYGGHVRWDREGRSIIFHLGDPETNNTSMEIFRVFPDSTEYIRLTRTGWDNFWPNWWYLNGEEVVFTRRDRGYRGMEYVVNLENGSIRCFSAGGRPVNLFFYDFSPDQTKLVTTLLDSTGKWGVLWVLDIPTGQWHQLTEP